MDNSNKKQTLLEKLKTIQLSPQWIFASVLSSFMMAYIFQMLYNNIFYELEAYYNSINFVVFFVIAIFGAVFLCYLTYIMKSRAVIPRALLITTFLLSFMFCCSYFEDSIYFILGIACVDLIVILWLTKDDKLELSKIKLNYKTCLISACVLFLFTSVYFGYFTSLRYQSFTNATFDFGIFTQMFDNMSDSFLPVTTVERSVEMSHFGVHFSPIYYLYLPLYMIFRSPFYLLYAQAISVALGVFAVYLICKKSGISPKITFCFELIYCFYPCLFNGCFYDFHENKILTTIILFLFYFIICDKRIPIFVFSLLLLMVKEDAAIYLIAIALYVLINKKKLINGLTMLTMAVVYFVVANNIVSALGTEGVMIERLNDYFINGEKNYVVVLKSIIFDIGYLIKMMFTAEKLPFIIWMFLPVMFAPFFSKKLSTLILLLPIIPINLMQSWQYQYDIDFQYTYGVAAMIIFCSIIGIKDLRKRPRHIALLMSLIMCACMSANIMMPKISNNSIHNKTYGIHYSKIQNILDTIEEDASVTASHYIVPHLYFVDELYTVPDYYKALSQTDYYVIDTRYPDEEYEMREIMRNDYTLYSNYEFVEIYKHK